MSHLEQLDNVIAALDGDIDTFAHSINDLAAYIGSDDYNECSVELKEIIRDWHILEVKYIGTLGKLIHRAKELQESDQS